MSAPARLLSVRLQGFKSFADRTHVEFGPGISAIVGPNGSGKSNLADALRWALGEQGRALRTRKSEDVVWAGSDKRPAVGMADVQLTLDNGDGLLPVEYGVVELGRRLYRSGENDYLLNRQRVRLKDLVDLLDAGHLAENAFLFIGQGMVDQALALRPEERRPLFEEVAGVRRHERRRRRAEEQLAESEANIARVDDILAELRPQARRLGQQAEQQANRQTAAQELVAAIVASAHARWHTAGSRAAAAGQAARGAQALVEARMAELLEHERAISAANAGLDGQAGAEAEARGLLERARADRAATQLREGRLASDIDAARRERASLESARLAATAELEAAARALSLPMAESPAELEAEIAAVDAELAAGAGPTSDPAWTALSPADAAAIRRLEAAHAQEQAAARRRASEAEHLEAEEAVRAAAAASRAAAAVDERATASEAREAAGVAEAEARGDRERAQQELAGAEATARAAADRLAGARATAAAATARHDEARRALDAAEGGAFSKAARSRGGRSIADGLIVEPSLRAAVDATLAGIGRAQVLPRADIAAIASERGVAIARESIDGDARTADQAVQRVTELARARGGGRLLDAVRRDDTRAVGRLLARVIWLPDVAACLDVQPELPAGWQAVARDGTALVSDAAVWLRPDGRGLHLQADVERLARERDEATDAVAARAGEAATADRALGSARSALAEARDREASAAAASRRAEELERAAVARADAASREAAWLEAQTARLHAEATRLRAAAPAEPDATAASPAMRDTAAPRGDGAPDPGAAERAAADRLGELRRRRATLAEELARARTARSEAERRRAQAEAAAALAERQLAYGARSAEDLAEREARLVHERQELVVQLAHAERVAADAEAALASILQAAAVERDRLRAAEAAATALRDRVRAAQEAGRIAEREELEARLALEALREGLLVELAGLGAVGLRQLRGVMAAAQTSDVEGVGDAAGTLDGGEGAESGDIEPDVLEQALTIAAAAWESQPPAGDPPSPARLATLRRRFHDLGAVNPFAADEYAEARARLDGLEAQRSDLAAAIERTRDLIGELDKLVSDQFRRTFAALERAFDARFQQLFGGGFARLALTDPDDLAATGIEITARPPGKKPQALAMLSGGERALTAVALLFAMLEVRPVPFCVLDEVDAALDEANIGRFTEALRDLSKATQCIVITHNRGTIEAADAMYGVTVGDDSVSRVISLRLDEATALADRTTRRSTSVAEAGSRPVVPIAVAIDGGEA